MIRMHECARGQHLACIKWWHPEYLCECACHHPEVLTPILEALGSQGVDIDTCDDDVIEDALLEALGRLP